MLKGGRDLVLDLTWAKMCSGQGNTSYQIELLLDRRGGSPPLRFLIMLFFAVKLRLW